MPDELSTKLSRMPEQPPRLLITRKTKHGKQSRSVTLAEATAIWSRGEYPATFEDVMTEAEFRGREQELTEAIDAWLQLLGADIAEPRFDF